MEEDIKILEKFVKTVKGKDYNAENGWHGYYDDELIVLGKAIENLIKGYRDGEDILKETVKENLELKEYIRELEKSNDTLRYLNEGGQEETGILKYKYEKALDDLTKIFKNSIPKSKVKEKIEELHNELEEKYGAEKISIFSGNTYMEKFKLLGKVQALQELMEDK